MVDIAKVVAPAPMEGHGGYNRSSRVQATGSSPALHLLKHAAQTVAVAAEPAPIVIADYGASEGRNSLLPMNAAIGTLREPVRAISVMQTMACDAAGEFGYRPLLDAMYATLIDLVGQRLIGADEAHRMAIPTVGRTYEEFAAPFAQDGRFSGLVIDHLEIFDAQDRIWLEFEGNGDSRAFGAQWAAFCCASVFPTLAAQLAGRGSDPRAGEFIERMEAGVAARLTNAPARMQIPLAKMSLVKSMGSAETQR
ncbi:MAG: hypothetical protein ABI885_24815 [Gammaproteobacteria bacterium]